MAERPFLGEGLPDAERNELIRAGDFDRDLFRAVYSRNWRRKYGAAEIERMKLLQTQEIGNDWSFRGDLWKFYNFLRDRAVIEYWDRQLRTGQNLTDPVGTLFYGIGVATGTDPGKLSDLGASLGSAASAGLGGPRSVSKSPTYQRNQPVQTIGGRGPPEPNNPTRFGTTPSPSSPPAKIAPQPVSSSAPSVPSGRPVTPQQSTQRPPSTSPGTRETTSRIESPAPPQSKGSKVPVSPRTGEQDPLQVKKPVSAASSQPPLSPPADAPARRPSRIKVAAQPSKAAEAPAKPQPANPAAKKKRAERIPSPREVEKGVVGAIDRDALKLPAGSRVVSRGENFNTIADQLKTFRAAAPKSPSLKPLDGIKREVLKDSAWDLMDRQARAGRPELKDSYTRLYKLAEQRAKRGDNALMEELLNFMKSGQLGARKPDSVVLVDEGKSLNFVMTDPTVKERLIPSMVHEFKSLFYREGMQALTGNNADVKVESWEHNPKLGIHREAQGVK